jgi:hypothetical protein
MKIAAALHARATRKWRNNDKFPLHAAARKKIRIDPVRRKAERAVHRAFIWAHRNSLLRT